MTNANIEQCANKEVAEFTDTDGDKVVLKESNTLGIDFYVNDILRVSDLIKFRVSDHTIVLEGHSADKFAAATVPIGQEYILKQALNLFARIQSEGFVICARYVVPMSLRWWRGEGRLPLS